MTHQQDPGTEDPAPPQDACDAVPLDQACIECGGVAAEHGGARAAKVLLGAATGAAGGEVAHLFVPFAPLGEQN